MCICDVYVYQIAAQIVGDVDLELECRRYRSAERQLCYEMVEHEHRWQQKAARISSFSLSHQVWTTLLT